MRLKSYFNQIIIINLDHPFSFFVESLEALCQCLNKKKQKFDTFN